MRNTCGLEIFFTDAYSIFSLFKRHHEIPLLRIQNLTFGSPLFLINGLSIVGSFGMRSVT